MSLATTFPLRLKTAVPTQGADERLLPTRTGCDDAGPSSSRPLGFKCTIVPRDDRSKELIVAANMAVA
jgi:hypothetical protein